MTRTDRTDDTARVPLPGHYRRGALRGILNSVRRGVMERRVGHHRGTTTAVRVRPATFAENRQPSRRSINPAHRRRRGVDISGDSKPQFSSWRRQRYRRQRHRGRHAE